VSTHGEGAAALRKVKRLIADYVNHIADRAYISNVWNVAGMPIIDELLATMLRSGDRDRVQQADLFVQDAVRFGADPTFARYLPRSRSLQAVRDNLRSADYFTRHEAIHTLGRTGPRSNARHLESNFAWYLEHDPLNLEDLLGELFWLDHHVQPERFVDRMVAADWYLARWALIELLWMSYVRRGHLRLPESSASDYVQTLLLRLAQDDHPSVRAEAHWRLSELPSESSDQPVGVTTNQALNEPDPSFFKLKLNIGNFLAFSGRRDYDAELVAQVMAYLQDHPITPSYDFVVYWTAFATSQGKRPFDSSGSLP
jgi:hypothetical protein